MQLNVAEAKNKLSKLIRAVERGEQVTIARRGIPVVELVLAKVTENIKPKLGTGRGQVKIHDPDWWKPMTDTEIKAFVEGRY